jgi:hypothetical protein
MKAMQKSVFASVIAFASVAACTTPGINYEAKLMATSADAAATRTVQVDRFRGPAGGWYARRFEAMLANTSFDGEPWFTVTDFSGGVPGEFLAGTYTGRVDVEDYRWDERFRTNSKCIEWDGIFDCETRIDIEELCVEETVWVSVEPRLIDADTGDLVFSKRYTGDASRETCHEVAREGKDGKMRPVRGHRHGIGTSGFGPPSDLVREALSKTLRPIRVDIAPRNATVKAKFVTDALDPVVGADPRFEQALKISTKNPFESCSLWTALSADYPTAPSVIHNNGACAEASSDFAAAQSLYAQAADLSVAFSDDGNTAGKTFLSSLRKVSDARFGLELIEEVKQPVFTEPADS